MTTVWPSLSSSTWYLPYRASFDGLRRLISVTLRRRVSTRNTRLSFVSGFGGFRPTGLTAINFGSFVPQWYFCAAYRGPVDSVSPSNLKFRPSSESELRPKSDRPVWIQSAREPAAVPRVPPRSPSESTPKSRWALFQPRSHRKVACSARCRAKTARALWCGCMRRLSFSLFVRVVHPSVRRIPAIQAETDHLSDEFSSGDRLLFVTENPAVKLVHLVHVVVPVHDSLLGPFLILANDTDRFLRRLRHGEILP